MCRPYTDADGACPAPRPLSPWEGQMAKRRPGRVVVPHYRAVCEWPPFAISRVCRRNRRRAMSMGVASRSSASARSLASVPRLTSPRLLACADCAAQAERLARDAERRSATSGDGRRFGERNESQHPHKSRQNGSGEFVEVAVERCPPRLPGSGPSIREPLRPGREDFVLPQPDADGSSQHRARTPGSWTP